MRVIHLALLVGFLASISVNAQEKAASLTPITTIGNPGEFSSTKPTVLITGANRGIGLEFVKQFLTVAGTSSLLPVSQNLLQTCRQ